MKWSLAFKRLEAFLNEEFESDLGGPRGRVAKKERKLTWKRWTDGWDKESNVEIEREREIRKLTKRMRKRCSEIGRKQDWVREREREREICAYQKEEKNYRIEAQKEVHIKRARKNDLD